MEAGLGASGVSRTRDEAQLALEAMQLGLEMPLVVPFRHRESFRHRLEAAIGLPERESAFSTALAQHADAIFVLEDPMFAANRVRIVDLAGKSRLPAMYGFRFFVDAGELMSYGPSLLDLYRRAATYVDKILKGAKPADLPVEQPSKLELVINTKTARASVSRSRSPF